MMLGCDVHELRVDLTLLLSMLAVRYDGITAASSVLLLFDDERQ